MSSSEWLALIMFIVWCIGLGMCINSFLNENIAGAIAGGAILISMTYMLSLEEKGG